MPSLNRNEGVACLECGREYTRLHASRHRKRCGVLKCSNCNFFTYSGGKLTNHIKKKHSSRQHNVKLCPTERKIIIFQLKYRINDYEKYFLLNLKSLCNKFEKFLVKISYSFFHLNST